MKHNSSDQGIQTTRQTSKWWVVMNNPDQDLSQLYSRFFPSTKVDQGPLQVIGGTQYRNIETGQSLAILAVGTRAFRPVKTLDENLGLWNDVTIHAVQGVGENAVGVVLPSAVRRAYRLESNVEGFTAGKDVVKALENIGDALYSDLFRNV